MSAIAKASPVAATVARKALVAVTGLVLFGFVLGHMVGNLQLYQGPEKLNAYAHLLQSMGPLLWVVRLTLLAVVSVHAFLALQLWLRNRAARPVGYHRQDFLAATWASRTMVFTGPILGAFIVYHLLHFTVGSVHPDFSNGDVYSNVVKGFQSTPVVAFYVVAMLALGFHLYHGAASLFQTLGLRTPRYDPALKAVLLVVSAAIVAANISFPLAVKAGLVELRAPASPAVAATVPPGR
jgi:succinate dehydrogenase / fumarate reductase cytochrome b subunit